MPAKCCKEKWPTIPDDEPVFVIRGKDLLASRAVAHWMDMAAQAGVNDGKMAAVAQHLKAIEEFQAQHPKRCKIPAGEAALTVEDARCQWHMLSSGGPVLWKTDCGKFNQHNIEDAMSFCSYCGRQLWNRG